MGGANVVLGFVSACSSGKLPAAECAPVWQLGVIAALLVAAVTLLLVLTVRSPGRVAQD